MFKVQQETVNLLDENLLKRQKHLKLHVTKRIVGESLLDLVRIVKPPTVCFRDGRTGGGGGVFGVKIFFSF